MANSQMLDEGYLSFTIESRILRELGERLVKQPEIALLELVKNSYDADAETCRISYNYPEAVTVFDDGHGMTFQDFQTGWMRIGTSSKEATNFSRRFHRVITGEKGIGRFAVRFLGRKLELTTVALDVKRGFHTCLTAKFDWPEFDRNEDLGKVKVPYSLRQATDDEKDGTVLRISELRPDVQNVSFNDIRTASMGVVTPYHALMRRPTTLKSKTKNAAAGTDPGFVLRIESLGNDEELDDGDVASKVLNNYVLRAVIETDENRILLRVYRKDSAEPVIKISEQITNLIGEMYSDIRFFPQRPGLFRGLGLDGRRAKTWIKNHSGVAVFDRKFRVHPYGMRGDDWLSLFADQARNAREPSSSIAKKFLVMDDATKNSTELNYMLRLPYPEQLVGIVQVHGQRSKEASRSGERQGLIPAADREGFLLNAAYRQLKDFIRGAVEAMAFADREWQLEEKQREQVELLTNLRAETQHAIKEIEENPAISRSVKLSLVRNLTNTQRLAERHTEVSQERTTTLEVMSLLGVVAGFMTHEFGTAIDNLEKAYQRLEKIAKRDSSFKEDAETIATRIASLQEFVRYSQGYIQGASQRPTKPFLVKPRLNQVVRIYGKYATDRKIDISIDAASDLIAPLIPVSLYNGIALNLYTNALKAVTAKSGSVHREIAFRAWNEDSEHFLEVSDTGIGIPSALRGRVFDPLFTTTSSNRDPLGSGMGLGLALVQRGVKAFGGRVDVVDPPPEFSTCFRVKFPLSE